MRKPLLGKAERARRVVVLGDRKKRTPNQRMAEQVLQPDDRCDAGQDRQPELLVEVSGLDGNDARKRHGIRAEVDRRQLLDHQRGRERGQHVKMLVEALENGTHRHELDDDAENGADRQRQQEADDDRHAHLADEDGAEHATQHADRPRGETEHPRGREHDVVGDADERVDRAHRQARSK